MITEDDRQFLDSFEQCSLGAKCWTHAAHVRMGWLVLETSGSFDEAVTRIRTGIMRFNSTKNSIGYQETITVAFARIIDAKRQSGDSWQTFSTKHQDLFDKSCLEKFYSVEILRSEKAREVFVEPDLEQLPGTVAHEGKICL